MKTKYIVFVIALMTAAIAVSPLACRKGKKHSTGKTTRQLKKETPARTAQAPTDKGIRDVDFKTHTFVVDGVSYDFEKGSWNGAGDEADAHADVKSVLYGNLMNNGREQAVVVLFGNWGGGNLASGSIHVYDFHDGQAWEVIALAGDNATLSKDQLIITTAEWAEEDPFCCPSMLRTSVYRWNGLTFVQKQTTAKPLPPA